MAGPAKGPLLGNVNMLPMIDILFQIVIFFMVCSEIQVQERSLPIVLPQASAAMPLTSVPRELIINVDRDGRYFAGGTFVDMPTLERLLTQSATNNPQRQSVVIRADERCAWRNVVAVMNACNKAGIRDYQTTTAEAGK